MKMFLGRFSLTGVTHAAGLLSALVAAAGCQNSVPVSRHKLIEHQALIDFVGLTPARLVESIQTTIATPQDWELMPTRQTPLYTHEQWRSPSAHTGVGVVIAHLPLPLSAQAVVWLARQEYGKRVQNGKIDSQWADSLGRLWFEGENEKYHLRGYVVVRGFTAWFVYFGYRVKYPPDVAEISLAARAADTAVPTPEEGQAKSEPSVDRDED